MLSGGGRTLMNLLDQRDAGLLPIDVRLVIASRADAQGVPKARARGLHVEIVARSAFSNEHAMHDHTSELLRASGAQLVCLCGYLRWMRIDPGFRNKVMNIHPSLLPAFGGKGMHGEHVHRAVLDARADISGCTVHFVDDAYDHGPIILQKSCPVMPRDTIDALAARVFALECEAYPEAISLFAQNRLQVHGQRVEILPATSRCDTNATSRTA